MKNMTIENIAAACHGTVYYMKDELQGKTADGVVIDSRQIKPGFIFVATKGERVDGHRFIPDVFAKGALAVICEDLPEAADGPCILVEDSFQALKDAAAFYRDQLTLPIIGIIGSVGKTSTKEFVAAVLAEKYKVQKTAGNLNNEVGLPLTIFTVDDSHEVLVLEMGINEFGEMTRISKVARPDHVIMTNIAEVHLENLIDRDGVLRAKTEVFGYMNPEGTVIVNGDDDKLQTIHEVGGKAPVTFGMDPENDIFISSVENLGLFGTKAVIHAGDMTVHADIPVPGGVMVYNAMAATAAGRLFGLTAEEIEAGIRKIKPVAGRSHLVKTDRYVVIDDCYNASPVSMEAALDLLKTAQGRTVAILGDMGELGENEIQLHERVGHYAAGKGIDLILCAGRLSRHMAEAALADGGQVHYFEDKEALTAQLPQLLASGDTVLVKASHSMQFENIVNFLINA